MKLTNTEAEFKEFEPRLKFKLRLKYGWFQLKFYSIFPKILNQFLADLSHGSNSLNSDTRHSLEVILDGYMVIIKCDYIYQTFFRRHSSWIYGYY